MISGIKGIGPKKAEALSLMGIDTLEQALCVVPASYMDFTHPVFISDTRNAEPAFLVASLTGNSYPRKGRSGVSMLLARFQDETGGITAIWFNQPYMFGRLKKEQRYKLYGRIEIKDKRRYIINPIFEPEDGTAMTGICPVYSLPKGSGISQGLMRALLRAALDGCVIEDTFPLSLRERFTLAHKRYALENIHFPSSEVAFAIAKRTVAFEELLTLLVSLYANREAKQQLPAPIMSVADLKKEYSQRLGFRLTGAQERALDDIDADFSSGKSMNRLLQGDVGSGKTAVAFYCAYAAWKSGGQCVIMAPTEILARQHFLAFTALFPEIPCVYIRGGMRAGDRKEAEEKIASGKAGVIVGTHAVLSEKTEYRDLRMVVTDEQHRFGVAHRARLEGKGANPHTLVMSATPIPRTLALVLYSDLDVSVLDELPPGREHITTAVIPPAREKALFEYIAACAGQGLQSYIVCPLVDPNEDYAARSAKEIYEEMLALLPPEKLGLIHGRMKAEEKQSVMDGFVSGKTAVLVSTTVIEVGINVPSAVNMVIVDAERFGLAQLHQLRGRVGRGSMKSYCFLLSAQDSERLEILTKTDDGFEIAEQDLKLRGPGDYFGLRQSGMPGTDFSALFADMDMVRAAKEALALIVCEPEYKNLYASLRASALSNGEKEVTYN